MAAPEAAADLDRRRATVVFVDLLGASTLASEAGIERAYAIVTGCMRVLDGIARRHGGVVDRYLSDALMAVFGFPIRKADAPALAVAAAVEMLDAAARYAGEVRSPVPLQLRIGINTGLMIAGDLRGAVVREFAVMGDAVNVAARFKDLGDPGHIHIGAATAAGARERFELLALPSLVLRGKQQEVEAFRVVPRARRGRARPGDELALVETPLVGRAEALAALRAAAEAARAGRGRFVLLQGAEGMGKSRLVAELAREARAAGARVLAGAARPSHADDPLRLALDLLADGIGVAVGDDAATIAASLRAAARGWPPLDRDALAAALAGTIPARDAAAALAAALEAVLASFAARGPLVVVAEDAHWADEASLDLLAALAVKLAATPALFLVAMRPDAARAARLHAALPGLVALDVGPLAAADAAALVDAVTGGRDLAPAVRARLETRAGGAPARLILGALLVGALETELAQEAATIERGSDAERRRVTVLFADITGFTRMSEQLPPAEAYRAVSGCLQILHEAAVEHGGSVDKYLGDCILAVFGAPIAVEDAPRAAVNAAIEMRRRVRAYNAAAALPSPLDIHVGINTGLSVAGDVSGPLLREFTLMGDAVSIASKLKDAAPAGQVWVGPETHRATQADFAYEAAPENSGIGPAWDLRSEQVQVYRKRLGRGATIFAELVGRDEELAALRRMVARLVCGEGGVAGIVGEAGLGKSRLFTELAVTDEGRAVRWAEGRAVALGRNLRFHPFVDLLRSLLGGDGQPGSETWDGLVGTAAPFLGAETDELMPPLAMIAGAALPPGDAERMAEVRPEIIDRLYVRAMRALIRGVARARPLVLFFEDLYWADRASIELLTELLPLASEVPVLFLYAARPGFPETTGRIAAAAVDVLPADRVLRMDLGPLDGAATMKLLGTLFRHGALPRTSRERIAERAGGNPLYVEELLRSLIEQGAVEVAGDGLRATAAIESMVVPATVQEVILARVDHLRPRPKQALQIAAVVGQRVAEPVLADLVSEPEEIPEILDALVEAQLLTSEVRGEVRTFVFKHRLIQDVTYESILETRRADLHSRVGRVIERRMPGAPGYHGMLAYHYSLGNDLERAEEELFLAGDDASRAGAPVEALELLQESSRLYLARHPGGGDPVKRVALHERLAGAYLHRGQMEESTRHFDEALALLGEENPSSRLGIVLALIKTLVPVGIDLYLRGGGARHRPPATPRDREIIQLMFDRARTQTTADPARFLLQGIATIGRMRRIDPVTVPNAAMVYAGMVGIFAYGGLSFDVARRFLDVADRYADPANPNELFLVRMMRFTYAFCCGDWDDRHEIPLAVVDDAVRRGQLWDVAHHVGLEAIKHTAQGRWHETDAQIDWMAALAQSYAYDLAAVYVHACPAYLYAERRQLDAALAASEAYLQGYDEVLLNLHALGTKAKVQVLLGDLSGARATIADADEPLSKGPIPPWHFGQIARSRLMLRVSEAEQAGSRAAPLRASRKARRDALWAAARFASFRPEIWSATAQLHWLGGAQRKALQWFGRALDEAERLGMRPEAARVRREIGRRLHESGAGAIFRGRDARAWWSHARRELEALDLRWDLARLSLLEGGGAGRGARLRVAG
ncbi:MAG: AAA family ATPase [Deltaproteobacteria bacterium]|nr:AAA family ATPase [Deltaproteobacteria bacterium]